MEIEQDVAQRFLEARRAANEADKLYRKARKEFGDAMGEDAVATLAGEVIAVLESTRVTDLAALRATVSKATVDACMKDGAKLAVDPQALSNMRILVS